MISTFGLGPAWQAAKRTQARALWPNFSPALWAWLAAPPGRAGNRLGEALQRWRVQRTEPPHQPLNFFHLADGGRLTYLPGYGHAHAGRGEQARWQEAVNEYLSFREQLAGVLLVAESATRVRPSTNS